ncbi:MAG: hypothetical protein NVS4B3_18900 [Gemmatimonadaceae bacterium]
MLLEIRPHIGDTLHMRLDQETLVTAFPEAGTPVTVSTTLLLLARAVAQQAQHDGTIVETVADSVSVSGSDPHVAAAREEIQRTLIGRHVRMLVALDGSAKLLDTPDHVTAELSELVALMPASLPRNPVRVGDVWTKTMDMPLGVDATRPAPSLHATFRLDSASRNGDLAYVSLRGAIVRAGLRTPLAASPSRVQHLEAGGSVASAMLFDRRRGWMTDARTTVVARSLVAQPRGTEGSKAAAPVPRPPLSVEVRVTQHLWAMDKP